LGNRTELIAPVSYRLSLRLDAVFREALSVIRLPWRIKPIIAIVEYSTFGELRYRVP
jgi:hypothetical protein